MVPSFPNFKFLADFPEAFFTRRFSLEMAVIKKVINENLILNLHERKRIQ